MYGLLIILLISLLIIVFVEGYRKNEENIKNGKVGKDLRYIVRHKKKIELLKDERDYSFFSIDYYEIYYNHNPLYNEVIYVNGFMLNETEKEYLKPTLIDIINGK